MTVTRTGRTRPTPATRHEREPFAARPWGFVSFACGHTNIVTDTPNWSMICGCSRPGPQHVVLLDQPR